MNAYFKNDLKQAQLVLEGEDLKEDFEVFMLQENEIPGLLKTTIKHIDGKSHYQYDISGKTSLQIRYEKMKLSGDDIRALVNSLIQLLKEISKYMLDAKGILLSPEYIFCEGDRFFFCYYPPCHLDLKEEFHRLTEFLVREVDYRDKEGIHLAYTLHKSSMDENYSIERIMDKMLEEETDSPACYETVMEEKGEDNNRIAEKKELWEPVKKLLERRKKEKWGEWNENTEKESSF